MQLLKILKSLLPKRKPVVRTVTLGDVDANGNVSTTVTTKPR